jgi:hypothetical protein
MDIYQTLQSIINKYDTTIDNKKTIIHSYKMASIAQSVNAPPYFTIGLLLYSIAQLQPNMIKWMQKAFKHSYKHTFITDFHKYNNVVKIMLCYKNPNYYKSLSIQSKATYIAHHTKYIKSQEINNIFVSDNLHDLILARYCYDMAYKLPTNLSVNLQSFQPLIESYLDNQSHVVSNNQHITTTNQHNIYNTNHEHSSWYDKIEEYLRLDYISFITIFYKLGDTPAKQISNTPPITHTTHTTHNKKNKYNTNNKTIDNTTNKTNNKTIDNTTNKTNNKTNITNIHITSMA